MSGVSPMLRQLSSVEFQPRDLSVCLHFHEEDEGVEASEEQTSTSAKDPSDWSEIYVFERDLDWLRFAGRAMVGLR